LTDSCNQIFAQIAQAISLGKRPTIVGISGAYTSGKTRFAQALAQYLADTGQKTQLIHYDDFHHPFSSIQWSSGCDDEINAYYNKAFDPEKLIGEVLQPLAQTGKIREEIACIDLGSGRYTKTVPFDIDEQTVVLLEGVLLFRPPLLRYLDYKIFLDIPPAEMLRRGAIRDVPQFGNAILEKYKTRYIPVHQRYLAEDRPTELADLLIDNTDYHHPVIRRA